MSLVRSPYFLSYLNGLHKREEERPDADAAAQQLDEPSGAEEAEEADVDDLRGVHDAPHHRDEVEGVPRVLEVRLRGKGEALDGFHISNFSQLQNQIN